MPDALIELEQTFGLEPQWKEHLRGQAEKRQRRQSATRKKKVGGAHSDAAAQDGTTTATDLKADAHEKKPSLNANASDSGQKSRIQTIKERNPAKNPANQELANEFVELGGFELKHGEKQKGISRMKVAKEIRNLDEPVTSGSQARKLPGVGKSAAAKVDEYRQDDKIRALKDYEHDEAAAERGSDDDGYEDEEEEASPTDHDEDYVDERDEDDHIERDDDD